MPCARAIASTVAESRPPDSRTTARTGFIGTSLSFSRHVAPQDLVELELKANRQPVREDPVGELARGQLLGAGTEEHRAARRQLGHLRAAPLVVSAIADHELDLLLGAQQCELVIPR